MAAYDIICVRQTDAPVCGRIFIRVEGVKNCFKLVLDNADAVIGNGDDCPILFRVSGNSNQAYPVLGNRFHCVANNIVQSFDQMGFVRQNKNKFFRRLKRNPNVIGHDLHALLKLVQQILYRNRLQLEMSRFKRIV
ncbi:hypothetical protein D3C78_1288350 [compost metagenome]